MKTTILKTYPFKTEDAAMKQILDDILSALFIIVFSAVLMYWEWLPEIFDGFLSYINY